MVLIKKLEGKSPKFGKNIFLAENATIIGDVIIGDNSSIWYNAIIRGDVSMIRIGKNVNIQDGAILHATYNKSSTKIEDNVSVGHNCLIHGCYIKKDVLIGMGAIIMDGATIESQSIIAAGSVVLAKVADGKDSFGYNAATSEFGDMLKMGILDPTKVTRTALQNASSIAGLMITTECMVSEQVSDEPAPAAPAMPDMGGMGGMGMGGMGM